MAEFQILRVRDLDLEWGHTAYRHTSLVDLWKLEYTTSKTIASQVLSIKSWIYESATEFPPCSIEYLYLGSRLVPLQTFTTRHSNRKLSIGMALSTTFTQCSPETTSIITQNKGHFAVQGHSRSQYISVRQRHRPRYVWHAVIVCLFIHPSQVGVLQRWLNLGSQKQRHTMAKVLLLSDAKNLGEIPTLSPPTGAPIRGGVGYNHFVSPFISS